jgi:hypothetical protein
MRTLLDVKTEKAAIVSEIGKGGWSNNGLTERQEASKRKRLEFLNHIELYLEQNPDELYLGREIGRIENRLKLIYDQFPDVGGWMEADKDRRKEYEKINDIPHLKRQLRVLRFLKK